MIGRYKHPSDTRSTLRGHQRPGRILSSSGSVDTALEFRIPDIANFLTKLFNEGAKGVRVSSALSTLELTRGFFFPNEQKLGDSPVLQNLRKSVKRQRPSPKEMKLEPYYDPVVVLQALARFKNKKASCLHLRAKAATLVCIDSAARVEELEKMYTENFSWNEKEVKVRVCFTKEKQHIDWTEFHFVCSCQ